MVFLRREDVFWMGALLLLFALILPLSGPPSWFMTELSSGEQASRGIHFEKLINVKFEMNVLGGKKLILQARRAIPKATKLGVFAIAGQWQGLSLQGVTAELPGEGLLLDATGLEISAKSLRFTGAVHLTTKSGQGILFCSELELFSRRDFMKSESLSILAPDLDPDSGGWGGGDKRAVGGKAVPEIGGSLAEIRSLAGR